MKLLFIDTETTGLDDQTCAMWQLAGIIEIDGKIETEFNIHMRPNPDQNINIGALEATNVTFENIMRASKSQYEGYNEFMYLLDSHINKYDTSDKFFMVGYNSHSFDSNFIRQFMKIHDNVYYGSYFWHPNIDVMLVAAYAAMADRDKLPNFKLGTVCQSLGITFDEKEAHDALYDVKKTKEIFELLRKEYK